MIERRLSDYLRKMRGTTRGSPPRVSNEEIFWSWAGAFLGLASLSGLGSLFFKDNDLMLMIGSFGASAILIYGAVRSPLAQPRNLLGGHILSATLGVVCWKCFQNTPWLAQSLAVSSSLVLMHATRTLHPPGGATALIAVIGSPDIHSLGFWYVLLPCTAGPLIMLVVAIIVNNIPSSRRYPEIWI